MNRWMIGGLCVLLILGCAGEVSDPSPLPKKDSPADVLQCDLQTYGEGVYIFTTTWSRLNGSGSVAEVMCLSKFLREHPAEELVSFDSPYVGHFMFVTREKSK